MNPLRRRIEMFRHRGDAVWCPVCDRRFARFADAPNRADARCWRCGSQERHRAQWLLFERRPELLHGSVLHFAPEWCLRRRLERIPGRYVTADLDPEGVDLRLDATALDLNDEAFDAIICSHVLEHVDGDAAAMGELRRVLAPGGWCLVMVPLDPNAATHEDAAITDPAAREAAFLQADHVRLYGRDIVDRLAAAGFEVEVVEPRAEFGDELMERARLLEVDWMFLCR